MIMPQLEYSEWDLWLTCSFNFYRIFPLFSNYIYRLCNDVPTIKYSTNAVLQGFDNDGVVYLELRTTPREFKETGLTKVQYIEAVLDCINDYNASSSSMKAFLILSIDRRDTPEKAQECINLATRYQGRGVVGVDLCGNPLVLLTVKFTMHMLSKWFLFCSPLTLLRKRRTSRLTSENIWQFVSRKETSRSSDHTLHRHAQQDWKLHCISAKWQKRPPRKTSACCYPSSQIGLVTWSTPLSPYERNCVRGMLLWSCVLAAMYMQKCLSWSLQKGKKIR